ncbi:MAG: two-component sensor histidine kinase [Rhodospirillales bacterium]|nr:two-component sensor histidine kinase [Rhodospirillales bacterium]
MRLLGLAALLAAMPLAALAWVGFGGNGAAAWVLAAALVVLAALVLAALWQRDLDILTEALRRAVSPEASVAAPERALSRPVQALVRETERLARGLAGQAATLDQLRRANEAIVERLPDPLIVLGPDATVRRANRAARAAFGTDIAAVLRHPALRAAIARAFTEEAATAELSLPVPVPRDLHAAVIRMDPPLADGGQAVMVLSDRTHDRAVDRMRADFIANSGHELRTPLASLIGFIDTLRGPAADDPDAQQRFLAIMAEQAGRMNRLIDDLLSLSRIEMTEHQPPSAAIALAPLIERLLAAFEPRLTARRMRIAADLPPTLPAVLGEEEQLLQVAQNLLDNAVKYGREGSTITIAASPAQGGRWPARPGVLLRVADEGPGIARMHVPRLTERFYRVDQGRSRAVGGTGLGLAIVKHIVNRHRGQLAIDSEEGQGTSVLVWLPCAAQE